MLFTRSHGKTQMSSLQGCHDATDWIQTTLSLASHAYVILKVLWLDGHFHGPRVMYDTDLRTAAAVCHCLPDHAEVLSCSCVH